MGQNNPDRIKLLQSTPFFGAVNADVIEFILDRSEIVNKKQGDYIFHQLELGDSLFIIESGQVVVFKSWNHQEFILRHLSQGEFFGELALLDYSPRSASVRVEVPSRLIKISSAVLSTLMDYNQQQFLIVQMNISRELSRRLRAADERWFELLRSNINNGVISGINLEDSSASYLTS